MIQPPAPVGVALEQMGVLVVLRYVYETMDRQHPTFENSNKHKTIASFDLKNECIGEVFWRTFPKNI